MFGCGFRLGEPSPTGDLPERKSADQAEIVAENEGVQYVKETVKKGGDGGE
jgi:hypothetical protein